MELVTGGNTLHILVFHMYKGIYDTVREMEENDVANMKCRLRRQTTTYREKIQFIIQTYLTFNKFMNPSSFLNDIWFENYLYQF